MIVTNYKNCVKIVCPQHTNILWDMHASNAISQWLRQWRVVKCCSAECLAGAVAKYSDDVVKWRQQHSKILNKLKINLLNKNTFQFIVLTSLICTLFWLTCCAVEHSVSRGSVSTPFRWGGRSNTTFFCRLSGNITMKELLKFIHICESYEA